MRGCQCPLMAIPFGQLQSVSGGSLGGPGARNGTSLSRPDRGKSQMWGMGNRSEPSGPDETSERSLFKVLEAKNVNRSGSAGSRRAASHRSSGRKALWLFVIAAVIATAFVVIPFASSANPDISGFELDGNVVDGARRRGRLGDAVQLERTVHRKRQRPRDGLRRRRHRRHRHRLRRWWLEGHERHLGLGMGDRRHTGEGRHPERLCGRLRRAARNEHPLLRAGARRYAGRRRQHGLLVPPGSDGRPERHGRLRRQACRRRRSHPELAHERWRRVGRPRLQVGERSSSTRSPASTRAPASPASSAR